MKLKNTIEVLIEGKIPFDEVIEPIPERRE